jgi:hypothetical protein
VIDVLDLKVEFVLVPLGVAAILGAAVGQHAQQLDALLLEEREDAVVQQIGRRDRRLAVVQLGEGDLGVGVDQRLLLDAPDALHVADVKGVLRPAVARTLALELAVRLLLGPHLASSLATRSWP